MRVAFVFRIHRDRSIAEHRLGTRGSNRDEFVCADDGITNLPQLSRDVFVLDFEIGDRGSMPRTPAHDVIPAIDESFFIEADKDLAHGVREIVVHGEVLAVPIDGSAEALHLIENRSTVFAFPFPDALDELLASHLAALLAFFLELLLDHHLRGDSGVIRAWKP